MLLPFVWFGIRYKYLSLMGHDWCLASMFCLLVTCSLICTVAVLKFCVNIKRREEPNQIRLAKYITKAKLYTYCFRTVKANPESCKFLDFQINICLINIWFSSSLAVICVKTSWNLPHIHFNNNHKIKLKTFKTSLLEVFLRNSKNQWKTPVTESPFYKVAGSNLYFLK